MKGINQLDHDEVECLPADDVIRNLEPQAEYYFERPGYTVVLTPTDKPFEDGHKYRHYLINGQIYESLITSPYQRLTELKKRTHENITFEFVEVEEEEEEDD